MRWRSGDGVTLDVPAPAMPFLADTGDDVNENIIVVMLRYQAFSELFMGDAGEASESRLLATDAPRPEQRRGAATDMTGGSPSTWLGITACESDLSLAHRRSRRTTYRPVRSNLARRRSDPFAGTTVRLTV